MLQYAHICGIYRAVAVDIRRNILSSIESDPGITVSDLSNLLGIPQRTVEREISSLKREGTIHRTGSSRNGQWVVRRVS